MTGWLWLVLAVACEVAATLALRELATGVTVLPLVVTVLGYAASFVLMVPALRTINVGVSYAVWSAIGTVATAVLGALLFGDRLGPVGIVGIVVTLVGVALITVAGGATHGA